MGFKICAIAISFLLAANPAFSDHHNIGDLDWEVLGEPLPKPISDHTATLAAENGLIYIAGGCDAEDGNVWDTEAKLFFCTSISSSLFSFDPETNIFKALAEMPRARYRHASVAVNNQVWLVGGRDVDDALVGEVDVYDIVGNTWSTFSDLPEMYWLSDLTGFGSSQHAFIVGGFNNEYVAQSHAYRIDPVASTATGSLQISTIAPILTARGDVVSTVDDENRFAYIGGGFTHANNFCDPLASVERYSFENDQWQDLEPLPTARADMVLAEFNSRIFAIGGERQVEGVCDMAGDTPDMGELTIAVDDVEVWDHGSWVTLQSLPEHRFRFAAVRSGKTVYTFGGQEAFDGVCQCMRTSADIVVYTERDVDPETMEGSEVDSPSENSSSYANGLSAVNLVAFTLCLWLFQS